MTLIGYRKAALNRRMEGKRAAAFCCLLIVLLPGQLQQVAALSKFCRCYQSCYPECRKDLSLPRWMCIPKCTDDCMAPPKQVAPTSAGYCDSICQQLSLCMAATGEASLQDEADDVEACVHDCTINRGPYPPTPANLY